jgi:short-subunit dehydrogenase
MNQAVLPAMRERGFGRIVNISSGTTRRVAVRVGAYAASKTAVNMLTAVLRQELAGDGIAVSLLLPSVTATEFGNGQFTLGASPRPGMVVQSPAYVAGFVLVNHPVAGAETGPGRLATASRRWSLDRPNRR